MAVGGTCPPLRFIGGASDETGGRAAGAVKRRGDGGQRLPIEVGAGGGGELDGMWGLEGRLTGPGYLGT